MEVLSFGGKHWSQEIAEVSGSSEFQTCELELLDPTKVEYGEYDIETNEREEVIPPEAILYTGQARLIGVRRGVNYEGATQGNSKVITAIRVQLPHDAAPVRLVKGMTAKVTSAPLNPSLTEYVYYLASGLQGSSAATRTLEFNVDGDAVYG